MPGRKLNLFLRGLRVWPAALLLSTTFAGVAAAQDKPKRLSPYPTVKFETSVGDFVLQLNTRRAPLTVRNFVTYVEDGFYSDTIFHRVIPGFMAQAGGFTLEFEKKTPRPPIPNEAGNGLSNERGTIAMARTGDPHSGTAQFFINLVDNQKLDPNSRRWGYCVFGKVIEGMDVLDKIAAIPTGRGGPFPTDVPQQDVVIERATVIEN